MKIELIYSTPQYHKLVETTARICYQSYEKDAPNSHNFIKAIMSKGHISIASVGNMVFGLSEVNNAEKALTECLLDIHEITQFVKWSRNRNENVSKFDYIISMNMLAFLDVLKNRHELSFSSNYVFDCLVQEVDKVPHLKWFYDKSTQLEETTNPYTAKGTPELYEPIVLDEDYTALKALGLNDYELGIHAQITMNFVTDRAAGLQFWRHWSGGCELSQRYVERGNAEFREMVGLEELVQELIAEGANEKVARGIVEELKAHSEETISRYELLLDACAITGIRKNRAKEIARSILPNNITTQIIQSRPYRNWQHLIGLRDTNHAQAEIREDVRAMKRVLQANNVIE